jgi:pyridoxamine 5'-phosphate oxidase
MKDHKEEIRLLSHDFSLMSLDEAQVNTDPFKQFEKWFEEAIDANPTTANAMTLCTVTREGVPSARIVLLRNFSCDGFVFYTNYTSQKGKEMLDSPDVCLNFFWPELERQVRINGSVVKQSAAESDRYFESRPTGSKLGAWASPQSTEVENRGELEKRYNEQELKFENGNIPRPPHWGGYVVIPYYFEFWQGRPSRFHDRITYSLRENKEWKIKRIAP